MWWYDILRYNKGSILHLLQIDTITAGYILVTADLVALKGNYEPILKVKRTEWRKFIDYIYLSIESNLSRVRKKIIYMIHIRYIPIPSSVKLHTP